MNKYQFPRTDPFTLTLSQKRSGQSGVGGQIAPGDDPDNRADRAEAANGNPEHFEHKPSRAKRHE